MNLLVIILSFILFSGINAVNTNAVIGIDVLERLKEKQISCDLHNFVTSAVNPENEYTALMDDLTRYCSESESVYLTRIVCRMILIELEIACTLPNKSRPSPVKYINSYTPAQVCSIHKITYTNRWIWEKLTAKEKEQFDSSWVQLCPKITSINTTLQLARFFYKIAPRIRRAEAHVTTTRLNKTSPYLAANELHLPKETNLEYTNKTGQLSINKTAKSIITGNKPPVMLDLKSNQSKSNIAKKRKKEQKQFLDNDDEDGNIMDSGNNEGELHPQQKKIDPEIRKRDDSNQEADLKKLDDMKKKSAKELVNKEEIFALGRAGEKPEREQVNERPKPKALELENVFKPNEREKRNWIEGLHGENQQRIKVRPNLNPFPRMKYEENPLHVNPNGKKKFSLRSRSSIYHDDDFDNWTNHFTTSSLIFVLLIVVIYLVLHNKNKILGLIIEGCRRRRGIYGRRFGGNTRHTRLSQSS